ncbi:endonuclease VII domain-containing protein [Geodermatophilus sp. SYSU D01176]
MTKFCPDCGEERPFEHFTKDRRRRDGLAFYCREHARRRLRESKARRIGPPTRRYPVGRSVPDGFKWCPDCDAVKPHAEFPGSRASRSGVHTYCKPCHNARGKASKDKVGGARTYHLKRRYGITAEEADVMFEAQGGLCAICRTAPAAHVDHDHDTGEVRELLCFNCNGGLGQFKDDPEVLRAAAHYVDRHRALPRSVGSRPEPGDPRGQGRPGRARDRRCSHGFARWRAMQASG